MNFGSAGSGQPGVQLHLFGVGSRDAGEIFGLTMEYRDISLLLRSHSPILVLQTHEERRAVNLLKDIALNLNIPIFKWSVATGMQRIDIILEPQAHLKDPAKVLGHINSAKFEGI